MLALVMALSVVSCGDRHKPQPVDRPTPGLRVSADYYGDYYGTGYNNFILLFQIGDVDSEGHFINGGEEVSLDILAANGSVTSFPAGKYKLTNDNHNAAGIIPSTPDGEGGYGATYSYVEENQWSYSMDPLSYAELDVTVKGAEYRMVLTFSIGKDTFKYIYSGPLAIYDRSVLEFDPVGGVLVGNYGDAWGDNTTDWYIYCMGEDDSDYVCIELVSAKGTKVAAGNYSVPANFFESGEIKPLTMCPLYEIEGEFGGTCYVRSNEIWYAATSGTCKVSHSSFNTTLDLEFHDEEYDGTVKMKFSGPINWTSSMSAPMKKNVSTKAASSVRRRPSNKISGESARRHR